MVNAGIVPAVTFALTAEMIGPSRDLEPLAWSVPFTREKLE